MPVTLSRRRSLTLGLVALSGLVGVLSAAPAMAAELPINTLENKRDGARTGVAINGYDTVAYFTVGKPVKGRDDLVHEWKGAQWKFSTQAHLDLFKATPETYAPQYGGYCAYGVAQGYLVKVDPDQFTVRDGKLYLNYNAQVQRTWSRDVPGFIKTADSRFQVLLK